MHSGSGWVSKRDRHVQLINSNVFDKETQARSKAMAETRRQKAMGRDQKEKQKLQKYLQRNDTRPVEATASPAKHEITVDGLQFRVLNGGSKLARIRGESQHGKGFQRTGSKQTGAYDSGSSTPKQVTVGGVAFLRSKNGNLYRSGIVKAKKCETSYVLGEILTPTGPLVSRGKSTSSASGSHRRVYLVPPSRGARRITGLTTDKLRHTWNILTLTPFSRPMLQRSSLPVYPRRQKGGDVQRLSADRCLSGRRFLRPLPRAQPRTCSSMPSFS